MFRKGVPAVTRNPLAHAPSQILRRASHATDCPFDQISKDASTLPNIVFVLLRPLATRSHDPKSGARIRVPTRTESHLPERAEGPARQAPAPPALGQGRWSAKPLLRPPPHRLSWRGIIRHTGTAAADTVQQPSAADFTLLRGHGHRQSRNHRHHTLWTLFW